MARVYEMNLYFDKMDKYSRETGYITGYVHEFCVTGVVDPACEAIGRMQIQRDMLAKVRGKSNINLKNVAQKTGIKTLRVIGDDDHVPDHLRVQQHVPVTVMGSREEVHSAMAMLRNIVDKNERQEERRKLRELDKQYSAVLVRWKTVKATLTKVPDNYRNRRRREKLQNNLKDIQQELAHLFYKKRCKYPPVKKSQD